MERSLAAALVLAGLVCSGLLIVGSRPRAAPAVGPTLTGVIAIRTSTSLAVDSATRAPRCLIGGPERDGPLFSPDGTSCVPPRNRRSAHRHVAMPTELDIRQVSTTTLGDWSAVAWSGDGTQIAMTSASDVASIVKLDDSAHAPFDSTRLLSTSARCRHGQEIVSAAGGRYGSGPPDPMAPGLHPSTQLDGVPDPPTRHPIVSHDSHLLAYDAWMTGSSTAARRIW